MKRTKGFISTFFNEQSMRKALSSLIFVISLIVFLSLSGTASGATTLYVGPGEAYTEIKPAIIAASSGDTIIVRDGIYTGDNNKNLDFGGKSITLKSENGPQNCIIDCLGSGRGLYFHSGEGSGSVVDGFTIKRGFVTVGGEPYDHGGGILCWGASPTITNCIITSNQAHRGGGIGCYGASPLISNCTISNNTGYHFGAGIYVTGGLPSIKNCMITNNTAPGTASGGGIYLINSSSQIINSTISGNLSYSGGAIYMYQNYPTITNCILWGNSATYGPEVYVMSQTSVTIQYSDIDKALVYIWGGTSPGNVNWGDGNINEDPLFVGAGDYHLQEFSFCVDAGTNAGVDTDIDGDARPYDVLNWGKNGTGDEFDMGADEFATTLNEPPIAVCKDIVIDCQATITAEDVDDGSYDPDGEDDIAEIWVDNMGPFSVGEHTVNLNIKDKSDEIDTCQATVKVVDNTGPIPDVPTLPELRGECSVEVTPAPTATDNCAGSIIGTTSDPLSYSAQGTYTVTWTYDDGNGNSTTQIQIVVVEDTMPPMPDVPSLPTITGECSATIATVPTATDNCAGTIPGTTSDSLEYMVQGTYTVTWAYDDGNGNIATQTQTVVVDDITAPEISVSVSPDTLRPPNHKMVLITPTITVSDNCDSDPTTVVKLITMNEGDETDTYDAIYDSTLADGHTTNDIQVINGEIYLRAERSGKGDGRIYTIIYTATDALGNSATATATVTVPHDQK